MPFFRPPWLSRIAQTEILGKKCVTSPIKPFSSRLGRAVFLAAVRKDGLIVLSFGIDAFFPRVAGALIGVVLTGRRELDALTGVTGLADRTDFFAGPRPGEAEAFFVIACFLTAFLGALDILEVLGALAISDVFGRIARLPKPGVALLRLVGLVVAFVVDFRGAVLFLDFARRLTGAGANKSLTTPSSLFKKVIKTSRG